MSNVWKRLNWQREYLGFVDDVVSVTIVERNIEEEDDDVEQLVFKFLFGVTKSCDDDEIDGFLFTNLVTGGSLIDDGPLGT